MTAAEPAAEGAWVAVTVAVDTADGGGVPAGLTRRDVVSDPSAMPAGTAAMLVAKGVAAERGRGVGSATAITRGVGVAKASGMALASGVALASAGSIGSDSGVITAWATSDVVSGVARREPTATATTMVTSSTLAAKSTSVEVRHALSAASSLRFALPVQTPVASALPPAATSRQFFAHPATACHGYSHMAPPTSR
jgi:hypothetical protein